MPKRLEQLVTVAAARTPGAPAVRHHDTTWSYQELDDWSNRVALRLAVLGVSRGDRVAVWAPKSPRVIAVFQAVLRIGAAYVPIDPATPAARAQKMLDDCNVRVVVTTSGGGASLEPGRTHFFIDRDADWAALPSAGAPRPIEGGENDLAYILYTSGSTGTPKGVCLSHRNALAFVEWAVDAAGVSRPEVFANHASFNFDLSVFDLYGAFLSGSTVCLVPELIAYSAVNLVQFIRTNGITVWYSVPSALALMMEHGDLLEGALPPPSVVIFAGEPFPLPHLRRLRAAWPLARMFNFYGPTETNVCTSYEVVSVPGEQVRSLPIGSAASGDRVWAVKADGTVAQQGEEGELYIDGPTVMLGYWGAERHTGPYRSGDICVLRPDGDYEFMGRRDHMIKCRGHRVELGEIEAALSQHPNIYEVAVAAMGEGAGQRLVAFVVPRHGAAPTLLDLKAFASRQLPRYMLIDRVHEVDALPRTLTGKLDRRALHKFAPGQTCAYPPVPTTGAGGRQPSVCEQSR